MKYIIMCGGDYKVWDIPRQLYKIGNETIVERTIRLLKEQGIEDIAISSNNPVFEELGVPVLHHDNEWIVFGAENSIGSWFNGFYPMIEPVCYLFGDVVFSRNAIKTIVEKETESIDFFASAPPFAKEYKKIWGEPFAFKIQDIHYFNECLVLAKMYEQQGLFNRHPMAWELWQVIKHTPINIINYENYTVINDYTCDVDALGDVEFFYGVDLEK